MKILLGGKQTSDPYVDKYLHTRATKARHFKLQKLYSYKSYKSSQFQSYQSFIHTRATKARYFKATKALLIQELQKLVISSYKSFTCTGWLDKVCRRGSNKDDHWDHPTTTVTKRNSSQTFLNWIF